LAQPVNVLKPVAAMPDWPEMVLKAVGGATF
jgi:hypothetical protein